MSSPKIPLLTPTQNINSAFIFNEETKRDKKLIDGGYIQIEV